VCLSAISSRPGLPRPSGEVDPVFAPAAGPVTGGGTGHITWFESGDLVPLRRSGSSVERGHATPRPCAKQTDSKLTWNMADRSRCSLFGGTVLIEEHWRHE
jgi:hypothetical protein